MDGCNKEKFYSGNEIDNLYFVFKKQPQITVPPIQEMSSLRSVARNKRRGASHPCYEHRNIKCRRWTEKQVSIQTPFLFFICIRTYIICIKKIAVTSKNRENVLCLGIYRQETPTEMQNPVNRHAESRLLSAESDVLAYFGMCASNKLPHDMTDRRGTASL